MKCNGDDKYEYIQSGIRTLYKIFKRTSIYGTHQWTNVQYSTNNIQCSSTLSTLGTLGTLGTSYFSPPLFPKTFSPLI
jgi:hypothetical protein